MVDKIQSYNPLTGNFDQVLDGSEIDTSLNSKQDTSEKGQINGYASLDGSGKVPTSELPTSVLGDVSYQGTWNANTNSPTLTSSTGTKGYYYTVNVAGTTNLDGITDWKVGDMAIFNGNVWEKIDNTNEVTSVFNRTGDITAQSGDYTASQVTNVPAGNIASVTLQDAINELDTEKQELLVSGTNIKTINGDTLLGTGNLDVSAGSGGYAANVYFTNLVSATVGTYKQVSYTPDATETIVTAIANNNEVLLEDYIFDGDVKTTIVPAGEWSIAYNAYVDNTGQTSKFRFEVFSRTSGGVETTLFSVDGLDVNNTTRERKTIFTTQPQFTVNETDRLGIKVYVNTDRTSNTTFSFVVGDGDASFFTTPLEIRHSQLRARDEADSHPISAITGLQTSLDGKANLTGATFTGAISATNLSGTNTGDQDLSGLVPYTGATSDVDLGANNLIVDTDTLFVDSTNNRVGIGINSPIAPFQTSVATDRSLAIKNQVDVTGAISLNAITDNDGANIPLEIRGSKTIFSVGNVGIGTDTPSAKLDVEITDNTNQPIADFRNAEGTGTDRDAYIRLQLNTDNYSVGHHASSNSFRIANASNLDTNSRITISSSGNVGIGKDLPTLKLDVLSELGVTAGWKNIASFAGDGNAQMTAAYLANGTTVDSVGVRVLNSLPFSVSTSSTDEALKILDNGNTTVKGDLTYTGNLSHAMGELYVNGSAVATNIVTTNTWTKVDVSTTTLSINVNFDDDSGVSQRLRYTGAVARHFHVACSFSYSVAGTNQVVEFAVFKNGSIINSSIIQQQVAVNGSVGSTAMHVVADLTQNDYIEVYCRNTTSTADITVSNLNFVAMNAN